MTKKIFDIDLWARQKGYIIQNPSSVKQVTLAQERGEPVGLVLGRHVKVTDVPEGFEILYEGDIWELFAKELIHGLEEYGAYVYIGDQLLPEKAGSTILRQKFCVIPPRQVYLGVSCPENYPAADLQTDAGFYLKQKRMDPAGIRALATHADKRFDEAIGNLAYDMDITVEKFTTEQILGVLDKTDFKRSEHLQELVGVPAVAAPAAFLAADEGVLLYDRGPIKEAYFALAQKLEIISMAQKN